MMWGGKSSLEARLIWRLALINVLALLAGFVGLVIKSYRIARGLSDEGQADVFVGEFLKEAGWAFPLFAIAVIALVVVTVRASLRPVARASEQAAVIAPGAGENRLETKGLPTEIVPFVVAVNGALDRLEQGFEAQRRFTADAAHELRTPLTILTAGLDALTATSEVIALRSDAARMGRLVDQLLRVARLDAQLPASLTQLDLTSVVSDVVGQLAPWAHAEARTLGLEAPDAPIIIRGDADLLGSALRNLIENAVRHAPTGSEVVVRVDRSGAVSVIDHGPGVPSEHRNRLFDRFWRAPGTTLPGAGLGLAIVASVAAAHEAVVVVEDTPGGGATFVLAIRAFSE